jgi:hypothetical protein
MNIDTMRDLVDLLQAELGPRPPPPVVTITTPAALDAALASAVPGAVLTLSPTLVYPAPLTLTRPVTLQSDVPAARMTADVPLPRFLGGLRVPSDDVTLRGIEVRHTNAYTDIVTFAGARVVLDRVRVLGQPTLGAKRGIAANGNGLCAIVRSYVDDCFYDGFESQAILAFNMGAGLLIEDNFLRGAGETIMLGGVDTPLERIPSDVTIRGNTLTKKPAWMGTTATVKNALEIKAGRRVLIELNTIEYAWKQAQTGCLIVLTVRNQDGGAPWTVIEDVTIQDNTGGHACSALNILGRDNIHPSGLLQRVTIRRNTFTDLDPVAYQNGVRNLIQIGSGPVDLSITDNVFAGKNFNTQLFLYGQPKGERVTVTGNTWMATTYGIFGDAGLGWNGYVASGTLSGNTVV